MSEPEPTTEELLREAREVLCGCRDARCVLGVKLALRLMSAMDAMREAREMIAALCWYPGGNDALERLRRELER